MKTALFFLFVFLVGGAQGYVWGLLLEPPTSYIFSAIFGGLIGFGLTSWYFNSQV